MPTINTSEITALCMQLCTFITIIFIHMLHAHDGFSILAQKNTQTSTNLLCNKLQHVLQKYNKQTYCTMLNKALKTGCKYCPNTTMTEYLCQCNAHFAAGFRHKYFGNSQCRERHHFTQESVTRYRKEG